MTRPGCGLSSAAMAENHEVVVAMSADEWRVVQEALDVYYYETEHEHPVGLTRRRREHQQLDREHRLRLLAEIDEKIGRATGLGPLFG